LTIRCKYERLWHTARDAVEGQRETCNFVVD
jgi:hypothetical protein